MTLPADEDGRESEGAKGGNFLDTFFVVCDFVPRISLLPEPEDPGGA